MKRAPYANKNELLDLMVIAAFGGAMEDMASRCPEKDWRRKMKTIVTYSDNMLKERVAECDSAQRDTIERRAKHSILRVITSDQHRYENVGSRPEVTDETVTLKLDDFYDLCDLACMGNCWTCQQNEDAKKVCALRKLFHTFGVPVTREKPGENQCEFAPVSDTSHTGFDRL